MSAIPGIRFDITGASGSQGLLTPKSGWRCYVLPRGGYASQDSAGTTITFDSSAIAGRFGAGIWIQAGLLAANIRQVAAVGGNSLTVSGAALTITENMRVYIIGSTEPTISGGSVTYSTPSTTIRQRDDDTADLYTNSMVTTNADGLVQFFSNPAVYDCLIQDGNQSLQGSIIDIPVGVAEGISTSYATVFGATVTINAALGVTGWATFGQTVTMNAALGVTGWATFGATVTMNANAGVTGTFAVGATATLSGAVTVGGTMTLAVVGIAGGVTVSSGVINVTNQPRCFVSTLAAYSIPFSVTSGITFDTEEQDVGGMFSPPGTLITIPVGGGGVYLLHAELPWLATVGESGSRFMRFFKNGLQLSQTTVHGSTNTGSYIAGEANTIDVAVAGDQYGITVLHTVGVTTEVGTGSGLARFNMVRVS